MQVVFAHYHLNRGGVTQVIVNQIRAIAHLPAERRPRRIGVLHGGRMEGWPGELWHDEAPIEVEMMSLPDLDYDASEEADPDKLTTHIDGRLVGHGFSHNDTILHFHNHALGKNMSLPAAVRQIAERGYRVLLQCHDFAEDFRPQNYRQLMHANQRHSPGELAEVLYPVGSGIHYAALTERDTKLLQSTRVDAERLHLLANPIGAAIDLPNDAEASAKVRAQLNLPESARLVLYPVRGIRRKNVGELLLLSALAEEDVWFAVTLAPQNPAELGSFERWHRIADELHLRAKFDICGSGGVDFPEAVAASDALLTTSVAEGFGMVFLESWLAGKPLLGRDLPEITSDAVAAGLELVGLYDRLLVPLHWVGGRDEVRETIWQTYKWACHDYGVVVDEEAKGRGELDRLMEGDNIDFAHLPTVMQERVIRHAVNEQDTTRDALCNLNPHLPAVLAGQATTTAEQIASNVKVVTSRYSMVQMSQRLGDIYHALYAETTGELDAPQAGGAEILDWFLQLARLHPLRLET